MFEDKVKEKRRYSKMFNRHEDNIVANVCLEVGGKLTDYQIDKIQRIVRNNLTELREELGIDE